MNDMRNWSVEFTWLAVIFAMVSLLGLVTGYLALFLLLLTAGYLAWHLWHIRKILYWLRSSRNLYPPDSVGVWSDIYNYIYRLQKKNQSRRRRLMDIISQFHRSTASLPYGVVVVDEFGIIDWFNSKAAELLGLRKTDTGQRITNLIRQPDFVDYEANKEYGSPCEFPSPVHQSVRLAAQFTIYGKDERLLLLSDVTRIQQLEQTRRDFVANVSHELRTPLTVVSGYIETMLDMREQLPNLHSPLQNMQNQTERMKHVVDDLLLISKLETSASIDTFEPINVKTLCREIREAALSLGGSHAHEITLEIDEDLKLIGSIKEIQSAFSNLVFNAIRYSAAGSLVQLKWYEDERGAHFSVTDEGEGIEARHIPRLTERFYRIDIGRSREKGGTGLGLAIVKHVLERHHATLDIQSKVGLGSCFSCTFPAKRVVRNLNGNLYTQVT